MKGRTAAAKQRHNEAMTAAWHNALMPLLKKFPKLKSLLIVDEVEAAPDGVAIAGTMLDGLLNMQARGVAMNIRKVK